jgi:hypothetical protein
VSGQLLAQEPGESDLTASSRRLRLSQPHLPFHIRKRLSDGEVAPEEIQTVQPQAGQLTESTSGISGREHQRSVGVVDHTGELVDLVGIEKTHLALRSSEQLDSPAGCAGDQVGLKG